MGNSFGYPSVKNTKYVDRLEEYRKITLSQILESYRFWLSSENANTISLNKDAFDEVFGLLFNDTDVHFLSFIYKGINSCVAMDVFYLLILLANDSMKNKLQLLFQLGKEEEVTFRMDLIQSVIYKVVTSFQLLFNLPTVSKEDIHLFVDVQISQFIERNTINSLDPLVLAQRYHVDISNTVASTAHNNHVLNSLCFG